MRYFLLFIWCACLSFSVNGWAATRYVATTGNDANTGATDSPYRSIKKCVQVSSAGDTCLVRAGTYTAADQTPARDDIVVYLSPSQGSPSGTAANPITIKSETPLGAVIKVPYKNAGTYGFYISGVSGYLIEGFDINSTGTVWGTGTLSASAGIYAGGSNITVRRNHIWNIARTMCSEAPYGHNGILVGTDTNILIEDNVINQIGRLRNGESGCSTTIYQHDHGIYSSGADFLTIRRNVIYDANRGYPIHLFTTGQTHDHINIYHNTISGKSPTGAPAGQIMLANTLSNINITNNIFHDAPSGYAVNYFSVPSATNIVINYNIQNSQDADGVVDMQNPSAKPASGVSASNNIFNATLGLTSTSTGSEDFTLLSTSAAINAGINIGDPFCGSVPDMGAFETCPPLSATISGQSLDITFGVNDLPLQVKSGATGLTVNCTGTGCGTPVVSTANVIASPGNVLRYTITGITGTNCAVGQTWTASLSTASGANIVDSANVGYLFNQKVFTFSGQAVTNACSGSPPSPPAGPSIIYEMDENTGTTLANTGSGGAGLNGAIAGGGTWGTGLTGSGVVLTTQSAQAVTVPYGSGVNPTTQSLTISFWVNLDASVIGLNRSLFGSSLGTNQRAYVSISDGTWRLGVQASSDSTAGDIAVTAGMHHVCVVFDSGTSTATLNIDGVASTSSGAKKTYTSYTFASNFELGRIAGNTTGVGGTFDKFYLYTSAENCNTIYTAQLPVSASSGTFTLETHRTEGVFLFPGGSIDVRTANGADAYCVENGSIALHIQIKCNAGTNCDTTSFPLYYSVNGGAYDHIVADTPSSDGVYFYGNTSNTAINRFVADGPLTGALSHTDGPTTTLSAQLSQSYTLTQNTSLTIRYLLAFAPNSAGKVFRFRLKQANGVDFSAYTTTPVVNITKMQAGVF